MAAKSDTMEKIVALCKRRGFIFQSSEIYGGIGGFWDYGPLGTELKRNIKAAWWQDMIRNPPPGPDGQDIQMVGVDCSIIMNPKVWEASGHVGGFSDPMVDCKACKGRFRADQLEETQCPKKPSKLVGQHSECQLTEPRAFNLMFQTYVGALQDAANIAYLRPETAQGIFANFKNVMDSTRVKIPFGIGQIGKAFRNEINPRNYTFRSREFEQMEIEFFCNPNESMQWYEYWRDVRLKWYESLGIKSDKLRPREQTPDERAHYSSACIDIEYLFPFSDEPQELEGVAHRGCFDLSAHGKHAKGKEDAFAVVDDESKERFVPHVIEPSAGVDRFALATITEAYTVDENRASPEFMRFHPRLAPIKAAVFPLVAKDGMPEIAEPIFRAIKKHYPAQFDAKQSIGKRYARMDEAGTPFCFTIDGQTKDDGTVTVRFRDDASQQRIAKEGCLDYLRDQLGL
ncbi:MAG TPA: glycine--tRNA ligase [Phycisphaerae bacterium]|nr:glycine--tRNA ligase [Phycisphaerae bacterium]